MVCLLGGVLLGTARSYSAGEDINNPSVELSGLVLAAQDRVAAAEEHAADLQHRIDAQADSDVSPQVAQARAAVDALEPAAGLTPLTGPALRVSMADAPRDADGNYPVGVNPDDLVVHQQDVQSVVNALWAGGAEAMMIMDQRVIATSAVRCIGNTLLLQGRTYSPPFVVTAVGDADAMRASLEREPGVLLFQQYVNRYDLVYDVEAVDDVTIPAYDGPIRMTSAQGAGG